MNIITSCELSFDCTVLSTSTFISAANACDLGILHLLLDLIHFARLAQMNIYRNIVSK